MQVGDGAEIEGLVVAGVEGEVLFEESHSLLEIALRVVEIFGLLEEGLSCERLPHFFGGPMLPLFAEFALRNQRFVAAMDVEIHSFIFKFVTTIDASLYYKSISSGAARRSATGRGNSPLVCPRDYPQTALRRDRRC